MIQHTMQPIFVIGAPRSGTSAIVAALRVGAEIPGYNEGHVLPLLNQLHQTVDAYFGTLDQKILEVKDRQLIGWLDPDELKEHITAKFLQIIEERLGTGVWVDKTPGALMIEAVPRLAAIFPRARFIFARRRGIENVLSRTVKFPRNPFEAQCTFWAQCMETWLQVRQELAEDRYIEIDLHDLALHADDTADRVGRFLDLTDQQVEGIKTMWRTERPEQSRAAQDYRSIGLDETGWTDRQKEVFVRVCGAAMAQFGYELEGQVFPEATERPVYLYYPVAGAVNESVEVHGVMKNGFRQFGRGFLLHPNWPGKPAPEVHYKGLEFFGHDHFSAYLFLKNEQAEPVVFRLRIESAADPGAVIEERAEVHAGKGMQWDVPLPRLEGLYDVIVSTAMAAQAETNHKAWAMWKDPHFSIRPCADPETP